MCSFKVGFGSENIPKYYTNMINVENQSVVVKVGGEGEAPLGSHSSRVQCAVAGDWTARYELRDQESRREREREEPAAEDGCRPEP